MCLQYTFLLNIYVHTHTYNLVRNIGVNMLYDVIMGNYVHVRVCIHTFAFNENKSLLSDKSI